MRMHEIRRHPNLIAALPETGRKAARLPLPSPFLLRPNLHSR